MSGRKGMKQYPAAIKEEVRKQIAAGRSQNEISREYGISRYRNLTKKCGITPSMSRRGNCFDNAMVENFFSIPRQSAFTGLSQNIRWGKRNDWPLNSFLQLPAYSAKNWSGAAYTAPLRLKLYISYLGAFLCCPHKLGLTIKRFKTGFFLPCIASNAQNVIFSVLFVFTVSGGENMRKSTPKQTEIYTACFLKEKQFVIILLSSFSNGFPCDMIYSSTHQYWVRCSYEKGMQATCHLLP